MRRFALSTLVSLACGVGTAVAQQPVLVTVQSEGWELIGDLRLPADPDPLPVVLLLNQAAGDRAPYANLASELARRGIGSLSLDLRGHGESLNLGRFVPGEGPSPNPMIWEAQSDVIAALAYLRGVAGVDPERLAVVGASYSGEEMAEAARQAGYAAAYVALSPGSFSDVSIRAVDGSGAPWLFVTSRDERFLQEIRASLLEQSEAAEHVIVRGSAHATDLLSEHPDLAERIAVWFAAHLDPEGEISPSE